MCTTLASKAESFPPLFRGFVLLVPERHRLKYLYSQVFCYVRNSSATFETPTRPTKRLSNSGANAFRSRTSEACVTSHLFSYVRLHVLFVLPFFLPYKPKYSLLYVLM